MTKSFKSKTTEDNNIGKKERKSKATKKQSEDIDTERQTTRFSTQSIRDVQQNEKRNIPLEIRCYRS